MRVTIDPKTGYTVIDYDVNDVEQTIEPFKTERKREIGFIPDKTVLLNPEVEVKLNSEIKPFNPYTFAFEILPWIAKETGLSFNPSEMEQPDIKPVNSLEMNLLLRLNPLENAPGGVFNGALNKLLWNEEPFLSGHEEYGKSILVHELTHYLQFWNGTLGAYKDKVTRDMLVKSETQAYKIQQKYLREVVGLSEERLKAYRIDDAGVEYGINYSVKADLAL